MANRKKLEPDSSPQAAMGARLRDERDKRGWKQHELGAMMGYSPTQVSHVETGRKIATLPFCRRADAAFGLSGPGTFEREWLEMKHGALLEGFPGFIGYEGRAVEVRLYEVGVIPGLFQTLDYAATIEEHSVTRGAITPEQARERVAIVADRQAAIDRPTRPLVHAVVDESCIRRRVGSAEIMRAQCDRLVDFAEQPNAMIQIAPFSMGERRPFNLPVTILTLPDRSVMSYAESAHRGHLERDRRFVEPVLSAYYQLQKAALSQADSLAMINEVRKGTP
ncbi:helix-turn-helix domain-containing protein [Streptomyces sp. SID4919]|uniref:helix-turn-helix domain-containing protein n=1 Tax=Streptomyces TaxID=1883 RepID=UPI000823F3EC|nr:MULTISPECIES: helix-turn-helix transcriptional regulator [unclassified Streptomyces]MYY13508.1 helix-turn-helix domain-containing protein [Streptomyces sp. SID4919]SCK32534.1 Predicted transcription factor, homolog of eukaryotic MBF1 [Streptomyces sp. AmelKG-E11A]